MQLEDDGGLKSYAEGSEAVIQLGRYAHERLIEREKTKRTLILAVVLLFIVATFAMLYAPAGREQMGYIIGSVLLVLALGSIGASSFILKVPGVEIDTTGKGAKLVTEKNADSKGGNREGKIGVAT